MSTYNLKLAGLNQAGPEIRVSRNLYVLVGRSTLWRSQAARTPISRVLDRLDRLADNNPQLFHIALQSFKLTEKIERLEQQRAASFFTTENLERVGKRAGKFDFVRQLTTMQQNPQAFSDREKLKMLQFVSNAYNDHIGAPRTTVKLFVGRPSLQGFFRPGGSTIYINKNSEAFTKNFAKLINTVVHENTHNLQDNPNANSNPILSRIYRANMRAYLNAERYGHQAYRTQPIEAGAHAAGKTAEQMVRRLAVGTTAPSPAAFASLVLNSPIRAGSVRTARAFRVASVPVVGIRVSPNMAIVLGAPHVPGFRSAGQALRPIR